MRVASEMLLNIHTRNKQNQILFMFSHPILNSGVLFIRKIYLHLP